MGTGETEYWTLDLSAVMNAGRHSPSMFSATLPLSKALLPENSLPTPATNLVRLSKPYQSINFFCQVSIAAQDGSLVRAERPCLVYQDRSHACDHVSALFS